MVRSSSSRGVKVAMVVGGMLEGVVELLSVWRCLLVLEWRNKWKKKKK